MVTAFLGTMELKSPKLMNKNQGFMLSYTKRCQKFLQIQKIRNKMTPLLYIFLKQQKKTENNSVFFIYSQIYFILEKSKSFAFLDFLIISISFFFHVPRPIAEPNLIYHEPIYLNVHQTHVLQPHFLFFLI